MSAFVVSVEHIDALITAAHKLARPDTPMRWAIPGSNPARLRHLERFAEDAVGAILLNENQKSVNYRCSDEDLEPFYTYSACPGTPDPVVVLKLLRCYEYQSGEHPGWDGSEAKSFCESLRDLAISALPGYREAPWGTDARDVFTAVRA